MLSILCVGRVIFVYSSLFLLFFITFVSPEKGARCYRFCVCRSCNIHPLFLLFFITFVSPEKDVSLCVMFFITFVRFCVCRSCNIHLFLLFFITFVSPCYRFCVSVV